MKEEIKKLWNEIRRAERQGPEEYAELVNEDNRELIEEFLGVGVAVGQVFMTVVRKRCVAIARAYRSERGKDLTLARVPLLKSPKDVNGYSIFGYTGKRSARSPLPPIGAINALANFWKHHVEWPSRWVPDRDGEWLGLAWDQDGAQGNQKQTMQSVVKLGAARSGVWNLHVALKRLGVRKDDDLGPIRRILQAWAGSIVKEFEAQISD